MTRFALLMLGLVLAGATGCAQCDTCDDFPAPCTGPNCGQGYAPTGFIPPTQAGLPENPAQATVTPDDAAPPMNTAPSGMSPDNTSPTMGPTAAPSPATPPLPTQP